MTDLTNILRDLIAAGTWLAPWAIVGYVVLKITAPVLWAAGLVYTVRAVIYKAIPMFLAARTIELNTEVAELRKSIRVIQQLHGLLEKTYNQRMKAANVD